MTRIQNLLKKVMAIGASDLHILVGHPPLVRINTILGPVDGEADVGADEADAVLQELLTDEQRDRLTRKRDLDFSTFLADGARFRVNAHYQRGSPALAFRAIPAHVPALDELNLPDAAVEFANLAQGFVLVTGETGSGKSTTLASMIDIVNNDRNCHIITIEDPIEFIHEDKKSIIDQREIGSDTSTFSSALRVALRQDPDVILVGEMRDFETIETALTAAETGHLVMSTLHTLNATETINRIISVFPPYHQKQVRLQLSGVIRGVISQRLVPRADGMGRVPAVEVLVSTARVRECIVEKDKTNEINDAIARGYTSYGMQSFDQSLMFLLQEKLITYEEALKHCTNPDDFALRVKGILAASDSTWEDFADLEKKKEEAKDEEKKVKFGRPAQPKTNDRGGRI